MSVVFVERRGFASAESGDDLDGGLDAAHERRDEDAVDWEAEIGAELGTGAEGPDPTLLDERRVPRPGGVFNPAGLEVVDAVAVAHDDDVLVAVYRALVGVTADGLDLTS